MTAARNFFLLIQLEMGKRDRCIIAPFALYEKQLFWEEMVLACFIPEQLISKWSGLIHIQTMPAGMRGDLGRQPQVPFSSDVDSKSRVSTERCQEIETEGKRNGFAGRSSVEWQNFDVALTTPEAPRSTMTRTITVIITGTRSTSIPPLRSMNGTEGNTFFCGQCDVSGRNYLKCFARIPRSLTAQNSRRTALDLPTSMLLRGP